MERNTNTEDQSKYIDALLNQLDANRTQGLELVKELQVNQHIQFQKELERLIKKYGKNSPRVQKIQSRLSFDVKLFKAMDTQIELSKIKPEELAPGCWRVEGFVTEKDNKAVPGLTVLLAMEKDEGAKGNWSGVTNNLGFYSIALNKETVLKLNNTNLSLRVMRKNQQIPVKENRVLLAVPDSIEMEDLYLTDNSK